MSCSGLVAGKLGEGKVIIGLKQSFFHPDYLQKINSLEIGIKCSNLSYSLIKRLIKPVTPDGRILSGEVDKKINIYKYTQCFFSGKAGKCQAKALH